MAQVTRLSKRSGHIYIDKEKSAGFVMGFSLCITSLVGAEAACGRVRKISASNAMIEIDNNKAKHIKNGAEVMLKAGNNDVKKDWFR